MSQRRLRLLWLAWVWVLPVALAGGAARAQVTPSQVPPPQAQAPPAQPPQATPQAQDFSATSVSRDQTGRVMRSRLYVSDGMVRVDPQTVGAYAPGYLLLDINRQMATVVNPARGYFQREAPQMAWQTLRSFTPETSPCPPGQPPPGASCRNLGPERVNGRETERWEIRQTIQGRPTVTRIWIDHQLGVPLKWENSTYGQTDFTSELQNIVEGPQSPSLFVIPPGLRDATAPTATQYGVPR